MRAGVGFGARARAIELGSWLGLGLGSWLGRVRDQVRVGVRARVILARCTN